MEIVTYEEALMAGLTRYFTGKPCIHEHIAQRRTVNRQCSQCYKISFRQWRKRNDAQRRAQRAARAQTMKQHDLKTRRRRAGLPEPTRPCPETCESCGKPSEHALCVDHCHVTGAFRGWLCKACNMGIGALGDTLIGVENAAHYLRKHGTHADLLGKLE